MNYAFVYTYMLNELLNQVPARAVPVLDPVLGLHYQFHPPLSQLLRVPVRVPVPAAFLVLVLVLVLGSPPMKKDLGV